jgi:dihydroflavonol-4-reductase
LLSGQAGPDDYAVRILVTGATGFLGSHLCCRLVHEGHEVTAFRRLTSDVAPLADLKVHFALGDISEPDSIIRAVQGQEVVIHAAAHLAYWRLLKDVQIQVNVGGTRHVVQACLQQRVSRLLHVSSVAAVGIPVGADQPADETFAFNLEHSGLNYHISKWQAEAEVRKGASLGLDAVIVNPSAVYGPFRARYRGGEFLEKVRRQRVVPYYRGGISVVHVDDVVDGILHTLRSGRRGERYILGGDNLTLRKLATLLARRLELQRTLVPIPGLVTGVAAAILEPFSRFSGKRPRVTRDIHYCSSRFQYYDSGKAKTELGYRPRSAQEIVDDYLDHVDLPAVAA